LNVAQVTYGVGAQDVHGMTVPAGSSTFPIATATMDLDPGESFTNISGTILSDPGLPVRVRGVASLTFRTSGRVFGPFGTPTAGRPFDVPGPVYAFHGAVSRAYGTEILTAIGFWKLPAGKHPITSGSRMVHG
jgi:hypothetical protein